MRRRIGPLRLPMSGPRKASPCVNRASSKLRLQILSALLAPPAGYLKSYPAQ